MARGLRVLGLASVLLAFSSPQASAQSSESSSGSVVSVTTVTSRDANGRAQRFNDANNREFAVSRDAEGRIRALNATRGPHLLDVVDIAYSPEGAPVVVRFRNGYMLFGSTDGRTVRDSHGRSWSGDSDDFRSVQADTGVQELARSVREFEALMRELGGRGFQSIADQR